MSQLIPKSNHLILDNFCGQCGNNLHSQDKFCRYCGTQAHDPETMVVATIVPGEANPSALVQTAQDDWRSDLSSSARTLSNRNQQLSSPADTVQTVLNNRLYVGIVIALIGPLGLPALWFSPRFSKRTKIVLTSIFVFLTTVVPLAITWYFLEYSMRPLLEVFGR